jgi:hypothetical protein
MGGAFGEMMMAAIGGVVCFVVIKEVMSGQNTVTWSGRPPCQVTGMVKKPNSVNPKSFGYGNTELNSVKADKCVETMGFPTLMVDDIVRTCVKTQELPRNEVVAQKMCGNRLHPWKGHSLLPSYRYWPQLA